MSTRFPAVVLAGGSGTRLWPFASTQSKALLPAGAEPLLSRTLRQLSAAGCEAAVVVGGPHARAVRAHCAAHWPEVAVHAQEEGRGTAAALQAGWRDDGLPTICVYGDMWFADGVFANLVANARGAPEAAHAVVVPLAAERPQEWVCARLDGGLVTFAGHPRGGTHRAGGAYALPAGFRRHLAANPGGGVRTPVGGMPHAEADLEESLNLFVDAGGTIHPVRPAGPVVDVDKPWHLLAAAEAAVDECLRDARGIRAAEGAAVSPQADVRAPVVLESGARIGPGVIVRAPCYLCAGASITDGAIVAGPSLLCPHARVSDYARIDRAVVGSGAVVGHCAEVTGVVMDGAYIVHYSEIYGVVGRGVDIGAATVCGTLRFDDGDARQRVGGPVGRFETPAAHSNAAYFGDHCRTGVNVTVQPGRSIGAYACVGPSVLVAEDVPDRTMVLLRQETVTRPWGPERYGW